MTPPSDSRPPRATRIIPWILWLCITMGFAILYVILGRKEPATGPGLGLIGLAPMMVSLALRLFVLPRLTTPARALPFYIVCLATAEAGGLMGIFLGGPYRTEIVVAAFALLLLHNPAFALTASPEDDRLRRRF